LRAYRVIVADDGWFLVGKSSWHRKPYTFDIQDIMRAEITDDSYSIPPSFRAGGWSWRKWKAEGNALAGIGQQDACKSGS